MLGSVISQATPIRRTISQWTWRQRQRPPPTPTTDEATTWEVDVGAPASEAAEDDAAEAAVDAKPSIG